MGAFPEFRKKGEPVPADKTARRIDQKRRGTTSVVEVKGREIMPWATRVGMGKNGRAPSPGIF